MPNALPLYRAESVRAIERAAVACGLAPAVLMARAGAAVAALARERWPQARHIGVLCGRGNNGGDGYVAALALHRAGLEVALVAAAEPATAEAIDAARDWRAAGQAVIALGAPLPNVDLWIDALFGVGLNRAPEDALAAVLRAVEAQGAPVLAVDVPSGVDADSGSAPGVALAADLTLCLIGAKRGLFTARGREFAGEVRVDDLGVPSEIMGAVPPDALGVASASLRAALPRRRADSHKGRHGRVLCLGGDVGMEGALVLCAEAAARAGAGSVQAWGRHGAVAALQSRRPEVMARVLDDGEPIDAARLSASNASVIAVGPGLGLKPWGRALFAAALPATLDTGLPLVLDADALNLLAEAPRPLPGAVLTPHPGEAARLLGIDAAAVQADRFAALSALVDVFQCAVVLKGAGTLVGAPGKTPRVLLAGNPGMASAGMGDVLTGVIAALRAQGLSPFEAATAGALAHSAAADAAAGARPRGLLAGDVVDALREVLNP